MPLPAVAPLVPPTFRLLDATAATVDVAFESLRCARAVTDPTIVDDVSLFRTFLRVEPTNASWSGDFPSRLSLDLLVSGQPLADRLVEFGTGALPVPFHEDALAASRRWTFGAGDAEIVFGEGGTAGQAGVLARSAFDWYPGETGARRVMVEKAYEYDALVRQAGTLRLSDSLRTAGGLPACCAPWEGQAYHWSQELWHADAQLFTG